MTEQHIDGEVKGILFDIQRFSVNDGPGVRTNLFFKGCPLRCVWCHNPESYMFERQMSFNSAACTGCMECAAVCPTGASRVIPAGSSQGLHGAVRRLEVDHQRCTACGACLKVCCYDARSIVGKEYTPEMLKQQVQMDLAYYKIRDEEGETGGITLTGGEPMSQFPFVDRFLEGLQGIHVCMETSGLAPSWQFEKLLGRVDLFLFDYKATDPGKHRRLCGADNRLILHNLRLLCGSGADVILRIPLIPGVNDDQEHLKAVAELIRDNPNIRRGEVMAYHNLGAAKAEQVGIDAEAGIRRYSGPSATEEQKAEWMERFCRLGVERIRLG